MWDTTGRKNNPVGADEENSHLHRGDPLIVFRPSTQTINCPMDTLEIEYPHLYRLQRHRKPCYQTGADIVDERSPKRTIAPRFGKDPTCKRPV